MLKVSALLETSVTSVDDLQFVTETWQNDTMYLKILPFLIRQGISSQFILIVVGVAEVTLRTGGTEGAVLMIT